MLAYICLINVFLNGFHIGVIPPLLPEISAEMSLTHTQMAVILGAPFFGMMLFSLIGGATADRFGVKKVISIAIIFSAIFCALRGFMPGFWELTVAVFLFGVSLGFVVPNLTKGIGIWFGSSELGLVNGALIVAAGTGSVMGMMSGAYILSPLLGGWRPAMWFTGGLALALWVIWIIAARERPPRRAAPEPEARQLGILEEIKTIINVRALWRMWFKAARERPDEEAAPEPEVRQLGTMEGIKKVIGVRDLWLLCLMEFCIVGGWLAFQGFFPTMLVERGLATEARAGELIGLAMMLAGVCSLVGPRISDRVGLRKPFIWPSLLLMSAGVSLAAFFMGKPLFAMLVLVVIGIGTSVPLFRVMVLEMERIGPLHAGSAIGLMFTLNRLGAFLLPIGVGALIDVTHQFWPGFLLLGVLCLVGAGLCLAITETGMRAKGAS